MYSIPVKPCKSMIESSFRILSFDSQYLFNGTWVSYTHNISTCNDHRHTNLIGRNQNEFSVAFLSTVTGFSLRHSMNILT